MTERRGAAGPTARGSKYQTVPGRPDAATRTRQQQEKYLEGVRKFGTLIHGCGLARVSPHTVYAWREHDDEFVLREHEAQEHLTQDLEREALRRAYEGFDRPIYQKGELVGYERVYSDTLMNTLLKARRPDKYRENINVSGSVEQIVREVVGFDPKDVL